MSGRPAQPGDYHLAGLRASSRCDGLPAEGEDLFE
jgi:hypothetical protein